jgi:aconitate hydratase
MRRGVARKLLESHRVEGNLTPGSEIAIRIDQTLTQDATGTLVMLELEAMGLGRVRTELSAQYVDHNLLQADFRNPDDHLFLRSACRRFGVWYSRAGNGVSHPVHMERFGIPGKTLLGADSHTPAAGSLGMLAIGAGGLEVALAMAGEPFYLKMPRVLGVRLVGRLPEWVSAKDVILEMLRRHGVDGGIGRIVEYHGPGLEGLAAMDRHVIANMGAELGATTTVFPADAAVWRFLVAQGRGDAFVEIVADRDARYDEEEEIDLSRLEPLIATPSSPGNVVPVREVAGRPIYQAYLGSSANPGLRDFAVPALMVQGRQAAPGVSFDVNPTSRQILGTLVDAGYLAKLIRAGARLHQAGCNGCIGMGQAPATGRVSLRTVPRNFPGRSGTADDQVYLCSPETATASALTGQITDPRDLGMPYPAFREPDAITVDADMLEPPAPRDERVPLEKGPNIKDLGTFDPLPPALRGPVLIKLRDDISTDEILPAGAQALPYRSNIPEIARFSFAPLEPGYYERALGHQDTGHLVIAGKNYGQGSSREHAALAPRFLGVKAVLAKGFARIHGQNLVNFGILPLVFDDPADYDRIEPGAEIEIPRVRDALETGGPVRARDLTRNRDFVLHHDLSRRQIEQVLAGGIIPLTRWQGEARRTREVRTP